MLQGYAHIITIILGIPWKQYLSSSFLCWTCLLDKNTRIFSDNCRNGGRGKGRQSLPNYCHGKDGAHSFFACDVSNAFLYIGRSHYSDVIMCAMASQITSLTIVYSAVYSGADQRKHQSSTSLSFVRGIHRWPVISPHKGPVKTENVSIWWRHHANQNASLQWRHMNVMTSPIIGNLPAGSAGF